MYNVVNNSSFPAQKKAFSEKNEKWRKGCINGAEELAMWSNENLRKSFRNKIVNYNLYSDILDQQDVERVCNPFQLKGMVAPAKMQNYPIVNPKIDLLVGELTKRRFDWRVKVVNEDAISKKEETLKQKFFELMSSHIQNTAITDEEMQEDLKKFQKFAKYDYQDLRERTATQTLKYLYTHLNMEQMFAKGFKDALLVAEEVYQCDIVAGEPIVRRLNPKNVHIVRTGESNHFEDADIILVQGYMSPGQIIDEYHDVLTPKQIDQIESRFNQGVGTLGKGINIGSKPSLQLKTDSFIDLAVLENDLEYSSPFDENGNIKVAKVYWKSMRKIKKVKYYDDQGDPQYDLFDEKYQIDTTMGEEEEVLWISEWWEGHKIGGGTPGDEDEYAIYVKMQPRPVQFRSMENPSKCHPGIVGTIYNTNDNLGVSLMDRMKPYQYLYNVLAYNAEVAIAKNKGKIMRLGLHEIPENWDIEQWMSYAEGMNIAVYDAFKEGNKGAATGKLAGGMSPSSPVIDMELGNTIQLYMNMMSFIKEELGEISGVSKARQGQIQNREAVGNVQREVTQSSHITEYWFMEHEHTRLRVMSCLLETAKMAWKDKKNKKVQYVLDDGQAIILDIDGAEFNEAEYGLLTSNSGKLTELIESMKQLAHAGLQSGLINFSQLLDIWTSDSVSSMRKKIETAEEEKLQRDQEAQEQQSQMQQQQLQAAAEEAEKARDFKREEWDREDNRKAAELETKIVVAEIAHEDSGDSNKERISLDALELQAKKLDQDYSLAKKKLDETIRHNKAVEKKAKK